MRCVHEIYQSLSKVGNSSAKKPSGPRNSFQRKNRDILHAVSTPQKILCSLIVRTISFPKLRFTVYRIQASKIHKYRKMCRTSTEK